VGSSGWKERSREKTTRREGRAWGAYGLLIFFFPTEMFPFPLNGTNGNTEFVQI